MREVHLPSQDASDPAEPAAELAALLRTVSDELQVRAEVLVVCCEPLDQALLVLDLQERQRRVQPLLLVRKAREVREVGTALRADEYEDFSWVMLEPNG